MLMETPEETPSRDGMILRIMGTFFCAFAGLVALGLFWPQASEARIVSGAAALALLLCGNLAFYCARSKPKK